MSIEKNKKVFVAMSGGVDSSVAAALLKEQGYEVTGAHMICWEGCENNEDKQDAMRVCAKLGVPFLVFDFRGEYKKAVFEYMMRAYEAGRTPNPDVMCNKEIKFGIFLKKALEMGADFIATGHYVRKEPSSQETRFGGRTERDGASLQGFRSNEKPGSSKPCFLEKGHALFSAKDLNKDQSYFLWTLTQDQLKYSLFPIGDYLKSEVRELARKFGLPTAEKKDSQGLCFVGKVDFGEFLRSNLPAKSGAVLTASGEKIGEHDGAHFYTIGQRHGLGIGGRSERMYIAQKDVSKNTILIAKNKNEEILFRKEIIAENFNWISGLVPEFPLEVEARIRYRQPLQKAKLYAIRHTLYAEFDQPQRAVAPGQSAVFYKDTPFDEAQGKEVLGGGIIA